MDGERSVVGVFRKDLCRAAGGRKQYRLYVVLRKRLDDSTDERSFARTGEALQDERRGLAREKHEVANVGYQPDLLVVRLVRQLVHHLNAEIAQGNHLCRRLLLAEELRG